MTYDEARVVAIPRERQEEAATALAWAFVPDPFMRYAFGDRRERYFDALMSLFRFSCAVRFDLGWPLLGVEHDGRIAAIAGVTDADDVPWPDALAEAYEQYKAAVGPEARARFERYATLADARKPAAPHHGVGVIGVHPDAQGRGYGRLLLDAIQAIAISHPTSTGVYLDTENPVNVTIYERCGYRQIGTAPFEGGVEIWYLFRPNGGNGTG